MLRGNVRTMETELMQAFADSQLVAVEGVVAVSHAELIERLAWEFARKAYMAVYALFQVQPPATCEEVGRLGEELEAIETLYTAPAK